MLLLILIACVSMVLKDAVGVFLVKAEAAGNERLAGIINPFGTIASVLFYSVGATNLTHYYGWKGYLGLIPVLIVDYFDGRYFTAVSRYIQSDETSGNAGLKEIWKGMKVVALDWMHRKPKNVKENNNA
jgi:hypothetical protein